MKVIENDELVSISATKYESEIIKEALKDFFNSKNNKPIATPETALEELKKRREDKKLACMMYFDFPEPVITYTH